MMMMMMMLMLIMTVIVIVLICDSKHVKADALATNGDSVGACFSGRAACAGLFRSVRALEAGAAVGLGAQKSWAAPGDGADTQGGQKFAPFSVSTG